MFDFTLHSLSLVLLFVYGSTPWYGLCWYIHLKPSRDIDRYLSNVDQSLYYTLIGINVGIPMFIIPALYYSICRYVKRSHKCFFSTASSTTSLICNVMREREIKLTQTALIAIAVLYAVWKTYGPGETDLLSVSLTSFNCAFWIQFFICTRTEIFGNYFADMNNTRYDRLGSSSHSL